ERNNMGASQIQRSSLSAATPLGCQKTVLLALCGIFFGTLCAQAAPPIYDVVVYGGTPAGIMAAVQTERMGKHAVLIEPTRHLGGMASVGLGATDIGNKQAIGGLARE